MAAPSPHAVLDLRERAAYETGHIFRATNLPRRLLEFRLPACWISLNAQKPEIRSFLDSRVEADLVISATGVRQRCSSSCTGDEPRKCATSSPTTGRRAIVARRRCRTS